MSNVLLNISINHLQIYLIIYRIKTFYCISLMLTTQLTSILSLNTYYVFLFLQLVISTR